MKKSLVIYRSHSGTTRKYGEEIAKFLGENNIEPVLSSIEEFENDQLEGSDYVLLGCWTSGWFFFLQHPDKKWKKFALELPAFNHCKKALFTTYKLATGSMFDNMKKNLGRNAGNITLELKSNNGKLSEADKKSIKTFIESD